MLKLKYADYHGDYHGFKLKEGFWYGINTETGNYIASSGGECGGNLAVYELEEGKWNMGWYDTDEGFELSNIPNYDTTGKMEFVEWLDQELGISEQYFDNNYSGSALEQVYQEYDNYVYDGLPQFAINYIRNNEKRRSTLMLKHLTNIPVSDLAHQSILIKERNAYIKANKFSVAEGGFATFYDAYCIGDRHKEAAEWLSKKLNYALNAEGAISLEKECEEKFDVQVWASHEFDIAEIKG